MYLPPNSYMNYGQPAGAFIPGQPTGGFIPGQPIPLAPGAYNPYNPYYPQGRGKQPKVVGLNQLEDPNQRFGCNTNYLFSPLGILRFLLLPALTGTVISSALVNNKDWKVRTRNSVNTAVWVSTLVFSSFGLVVNFIMFLWNVCNISNLSGCRLVPWTILQALFDLGWFVALTVLGAFCARREAVNNQPFKALSISKGAFGCAAAFALLSALLFLLSALVGFAYRRTPRRLTRVR